jgi:hypothetical protein
MSDELKECPFCGAKGMVIEIDGYRPSSPVTYQPLCSDHNCSIEGLHFSTEAEAAEWWNRRAPVPNAAGGQWMPDSVKDDIGLCASAVVLAYHRKTHEHILADDDTFKAALRVEKYLGRR